MNLLFVARIIGRLLLLLSICLTVPLAVSLYDQILVSDHIAFSIELRGFIAAVLSSAVAGGVLAMIPGDSNRGSGVREGFAIVTFGWIAAALFSAIPLATWFIATDPSLPTLATVANHCTNSFFENVSGFTTTGSTILTDIESVPRSLLFWRAMTHWIGGMGIITLVLALFPASGITSYQMFRGEVPGPTAEKIGPHLGQTAQILWGVYVLLTLVESLALHLAGMPLFDAICHSFATMATGGFSTKNGSIAAYDSPIIHWIITFFMFTAGCNFIVHYQLIFKKNVAVLSSNKELHFYVKVIIIAILFSVLSLQIQGIVPENVIASTYRSSPMDPAEIAVLRHTEQEKIASLGSTLQYASFQVVSIVTTTGFITADFDIWPNVVKAVLVVLMLCGGCSGSTAGGIKMIRIQVVLEVIKREVARMVQPKSIRVIKIGKECIEEKQVANIIGFVVLFVTVFVSLCFAMSFFIEDFTTAMTAVIATLGNIGPGLSGVGATENFNWIPMGGKWVLTLSMLLGRLELYTVFIAISPRSWRK